jgi:hypothetical protein
VRFAHYIARRALVAVALVAAFAPASAVARTSTITHTFASAADITVSFTLPRHPTSGELVRFKRNHVSVVRTRNETLSLRAKGRRSRGIGAPRKRSRRVVVTLSQTSGRVTLARGGRTVSLRGEFVAESAVAVRRGAVASLRISTRRAGSPVTPIVPPVPPPTSAGARVRFFAPDSVWNAPLPADAPQDPASDALVGTLRNTVAQNIAAGWGPWISTYDTPPLYIVPADQPTVRVQLDPGSWKVGLQRAFEAVPIPANADPTAGVDGELTVWQPATDRLWELFEARKLPDGWHASFGGAMANVSRSRGYFDTDSWPGLSQRWWGATASSLPVIAGTIMIDELKAGVIPHALAMNIPWAKPNVYSWPAQRTDGASTDANAIPEGARFRLDPHLDIASLDVPPMTRMMAVAAQRYGIIVRDQTAHAIGFFAEVPRPGSDVYTSTTGFFGGPYPTAVMQAFPWDHLRLLKMDLHTIG